MVLFANFVLFDTVKLSTMHNTCSNLIVRFTLLLVSVIAIPGAALADLRFSSAQNGGFPLVGKDIKADILIDAGDDEVVSTVAQCVASDVKAVTGQGLDVCGVPGKGQALVIAGTIGQSRWIDSLVAEAIVDTAGVAGQWEAYRLQLVQKPMEGVEQALVVMGGTPRGTAYGLFEISRRIGVSPYIWWADVAPAPMPGIYVEGDKTQAEAPSVKYRGLFINDEDWAMLPWAKKTFDVAYGNIGPNIYDKVMELLLRLRGNCLWPAKHQSSRAFWSSDDNKRLAHKWCMVMSSGDSMLRDNLWEWTHFGGTTSNFSFAFNSAQVSDYWAKRAGESRGYEGIYDIGMRGCHDVALLGYEGQDAQLAGLRDIIACQRQIITDSLGGDPAKVPQIYIPYKEALTLYNAGLEVPGDVTLCWVDDNYGYIRQLPTAAEQRRSGGNGVYYHLSYLGNPCSYIWLSTMSPSLVSYEMCKAYENGVRRFWMVNVGDIKPAEVELEFFMELAWDVEAWTPDKASRFARWWSARTFGEDYADELAAIRLEHYRLAAQSKPETVREVTFTTEEKIHRINDYKALVDRVYALEGSIPERLRDAYFELVTYPVVATASMNFKLIGANLSHWYAGMGDHARSMAYAALSRAGYDDIVHLTARYNQEVAGGKWNHMMSMSPNAGANSQFDQVYAALSTEVNDVQGGLLPVDDNVYVDASAYTSSRGDWMRIDNLGVGDHSMTVWPMDYTTYTAATARSRGPYLEYRLPLEKGKYQIVVRCLPTFPVTPGADLVVGMSMGSGSVSQSSIKAGAETNVWNDNVMHGYAEARFTYSATSAKDYRMRVYAMNTALVVSQIVYRRMDAVDEGNIADEVMVNPDFELYQSGSTVIANTTGAIRRGIPYGWQLKGALSGNSYGICKDASIREDDGNLCWIKSSPMPQDCELYQIIPAGKLAPGVYEVGCLLWNQSGKRGSCRLFANDHVQYYSHKGDYDQILKEGEFSTYATYKAGYETHTIMHPMRVVLAVHEGEDLRVGIRTGCESNAGVQDDDTGWFKVDKFTLRRLGDIDTADPDSLTRALIVNPDFEYSAEGELAGGRNVTGNVPYGWQMSCSGTYSMAASGIYGKGEGMHGLNYCAFTPSGYSPMPQDFMLYQTIPAGKLKAGATYRVSCLMWSEEGKEGRGRLFANSQVQYFGSPYSYTDNLTQGEHSTFACYTGARLDAKSMQEVSVTVTVQEGEDLTLGIKSGSLKGDGTAAVGTDRTGKFRVDNFRIEQVSADDPETAMPGQAARASHADVYDLMGRKLPASRIPARGVYIMSGRKYVR